MRDCICRCGNGCARDFRSSLTCFPPSGEINSLLDCSAGNLVDRASAPPITGEEFCDANAKFSKTFSNFFFLITKLKKEKVSRSKDIRGFEDLIRDRRRN